MSLVLVCNISIYAYSFKYSVYVNWMNGHGIRPSHVQIPGEPKMASLSRWAIDGSCTVDLGMICVVHIFCRITVGL